MGQMHPSAILLNVFFFQNNSCKNTFRPTDQNYRSYKMEHFVFSSVILHLIAFPSCFVKLTFSTCNLLFKLLFFSISVLRIACTSSLFIFDSFRPCFCASSVSIFDCFRPYFSRIWMRIAALSAFRLLISSSLSILEKRKTEQNKTRYLWLISTISNCIECQFMLCFTYRT